ncbi:MAG: 1-acyl-sn-glycerol-3-phosphate acyltransferase, partial [Deltaproteobacteria bacterium]|nr:1-acyl-sn-glycerol-3-phosphate acyltransferase [Deltaproteobacteria bacterium]
PAASDGVPSETRAAGASRAVRAAVATIARRTAAEVAPGQTLRGDLGFDSLMLLELLVAMEAQLGGAVDAERMTACETVGDVEALVAESTAGRRLARSTPRTEVVEDDPIELPPALRKAAMRWLGTTQQSFYSSVMRTKVTGRAFIPENRSVIVAANHASHLDMGLVKYALGEYGQGMISLAAQDYFFEGPRWRNAYFENFTNLVPISRTGSLRQSLRRAGALVEAGETVLIFPEGTRSLDGGLQEFKPAVGYLALQHRADVLPMWLGGTHRALPKGARVIRSRDLTVRIGPPLTHAELKRLTAGMTVSDASRAAALLLRRAVAALSRGEVLDTSALGPTDLAETPRAESLAELFQELESRFVRGTVSDPVSFYFALGKSERWTVRVTPDACEVTPGKAAASADCVLKTSPAMFTRIVREAYTPTPGEFVAGAVKSNNIALLLTFQRVFALAGEGA